jgi:hypothetical protein
VIHYTETKYGFEYGAAHVDRLTDDERKGWVVIGVTTPRHALQLYITKTGHVRIFESGVPGEGTREIRLRENRNAR